MNSLVGYTGFVGSNIAKSAQFDGLYNSKNIGTAYGTRPDKLIYSGVPAEMFLANHYPEKDFEVIKQAIENIKKIAPKQIVLISTISVYGMNAFGDEDSTIEKDNLSAYGYNRLYLENWVEENFDNSLIVRLPALYGNGIKKNFIYDYIHVIPALLKYEKYEELIKTEDELTQYYVKQDNGFYRCKQLDVKERKKLISLFKKVGFSALNFTDSRSKYQFYNLKYLWNHILRAEEVGIHKLNLTTEPVSVSELFMYLEGVEFVNKIMEQPFDYNLKTKYAEDLYDHEGYIFDKEFVKNDVKRFIDEMRVKEGLV